MTGIIRLNPFNIVILEGEDVRSTVVDTIIKAIEVRILKWEKGIR